MSDNIESEIKVESQVKSDVVPSETPILKLESKSVEPEFNLNDVFINDEDTFECTVNFKKEGNKYYTEGSEEFAQSKSAVAKIVFTCKYPAVKEYQAIMAASKSGGAFSPQDVTLMELTRLYSLIKKWNLPKNLSEIVNISPVLVKAMLNKVQEKIGLEGII